MSFRKILLALAALFGLPTVVSAQLTWGTAGSGGTGTWDSTSLDWYDGTNNLAWVAGDTATFAGPGGPVTLSGTQTASQLTFNSTAPYLLTGGTLGGTDADLTIEADTNAEIDSPIVDASATTLTKTGTGTLTLTGTNTYTGGTVISAGTLEVAADNNLGATSGGITLSGGGELLTDNASGFTTNRTISITDTGTLAAVTGTTATYSGTISGGTLTIGDSTNNGTITFSDTVTDSGGSGSNGGDGSMAVTAYNNSVFTNNGAITGGGGGNGVSALNGTGGGDGAVAVTLDTDASLINDGTVAGGNGGDGGSGSDIYNGGGPGRGGNGGTAVTLSASASLTNNGTITGGSAGSGYNGGVGGTAITASGNDVVINAGSITAGEGYFGEENAEADAIDLNGGGNTLVLESGFTIVGNVVSQGGDTLELGGTTNGTFDVSTIGASAQYQGFANFAKTGVGTWTLMNTTTAVTPWTISGGVLSIASDASLGATSGGITLSGGGELLTDNASGFTTNRTITITDTGTLAAFTGTTATYSDAISGGTLTIGDATNNGAFMFSNTVIVTGSTGSAGSVDLHGYYGGSGGNEGLAVILDTGTNLTNYGTITGGTGGTGSGGNYGSGSGGVGGGALSLDPSTSLTNNGTITGGSGGGDTGVFFQHLASGGNGGVAVTLDTSASLLNNGSITGGTGGGGSVGNGGSGGNGGVAAALAMDANVTNNGTVAGGNGGIGNGESAGVGGTAVTIATGAGLINNDTIVGGSGGANIGLPGNGGVGGVAVDLFTGASLANNGTIAGGVGGSGNGGKGGDGGEAVTLETGAAFTNGGTINGGNGGGGTSVIYGINGGNGGVGVALNTSASLVNTGTVTGGIGGSGGVANNNGSSNAGNNGNGGTAVTLATGASLSNSGAIVGGLGGSGSGSYGTGNGGTAVALATSTSLTNTGTITGGSGGSGNGYSGSGGNGAVAITVSGNGLIINAGSITGGAGTFSALGLQADAVDLSGGGNTLELYSTSQITGNVVSASGSTNGGDTLELGGTTNGTFAGSSIGASAQYQGFANYVKTGPGTWTLTGTTTAVTPWTLSQGILSISSDGGLGDDSGAVTFNGGTLQTTASFASSRNVTLNAGGGTIDTDGNSVTLSGSISGSGGFTLNDSAGTGTLILTGTNTYTGGTTISAGTLEVASQNNLGGTNAGSLTLNGGELLTTANTTIAEGVTLNAGNDILAAATSTSATYSGVINGPGTLVIGDGTNNGMVVLTGTKTYDDGITINNGSTLQAATELFYGDVADNGNLVLINLVPAQTFLGSQEYGGVISGPGSLTIAAFDTVYLTGANTYTGGTTIMPGATLVIGNMASLETISGISGSIVGNVVDNGTLEFNISNTNVGGDTVSDLPPSKVTLDGAISGTGGVVKDNTATLVLTGANTYSGGTTINIGTLQIGNGGTSGTLGYGGVTGDAYASLVFDRSDSPTFANAISGAVALLQSGSGTLILSGTNTYAGGTTVSNGVVEVAAVNTNLGTGGITLGGGELVTTTSSSTSQGIVLMPDNLPPPDGIYDPGHIYSSGIDTLAAANGTIATYTGTISGAGALIVGDSANTGTLILAGTNTYTGPTIVQNGTLDLDGSTGSISSQSNLVFNGTGTFNYDNTNAGSTAQQQALGTLTFNGGDGVVTATLGHAASTTLGFTSLSRATGATGNFVVADGSNGSTNGTASKITIAGQPAGFISPGVFFDGNNFATYDSAGYVRGINYGVDPNSLVSGGGSTISGTLTSLSNVELTGGIAAQNSASINTLNLGNNSLTLGTSQTLTVNGILESGGSATISGGNGIAYGGYAGESDLVVRTNLASDTLNIDTSVAAANLTKSGAGTLNLNGSYTGNTLIASGSIGLSAGSSVTGNITVGSGSSIGGGGTVNGKITVASGGSTYPGDPQILTANSVEYQNGSTAQFSIATTGSSSHPPTPGVDYDQIQLTGGPAQVLQIDAGTTTLQLNLSATSLAAVQANAQNNINDLYFVFNLGTGTSSGQFTDLTLTEGAKIYTDAITSGEATFDQLGLQFNLSYTANETNNSLLGGNDVAFNVQSIPEPCTWGLLLAPLALLAFSQTRRSKFHRAPPHC